MKMFIALMGFVTIAAAEPPVGDGYPAARPSNDGHHHHTPLHLQRSLSEEYGPPSDFARNAPGGYNYDAPNTRSSGHQYPPATVRVSFNQRFGSANSRSANQGYSPARSLSQEYPAPFTRSGISQEYGAPEARSLSQEYGIPSVEARTLSTEYGVPNARSSPSEEYGVPVVAARSNQRQLSTSNFRSADAFAARSNHIAQGYNSPRPFTKSVSSSRTPSSTYAASSRSVSTSYGAPSARNSDSYSEKPSEMYGAPNSRSLSQEYGLPSSRSNLNTNAIASAFTASSFRSSPSSTYLPASRTAAPSEQYGVPEQRDTSSQGYDYAQSRALEELLNQEPANYDFTYQIEDQESGSDFGHAETREVDRVEGSYFVVLPDGTRQTVEYEADENGFKPRISVEAADLSVQGYDDNAAEIVAARSAGGPY